MSGGLLALLDDITAIVRLSAASLDDVGAAAAKASAKAVGVVIDDAAVTPSYAAGFAPARELPIVWGIAKGSIVNKVVYILPAALLLSQFMPWALTPLLMLGGAYLCFEGAEKVIEAVSGAEDSEETQVGDSAQRERLRVAGAIRTDFILSTEIMVIALGEVADQPLLTRALSLIVVAFVITALVYGVVACIVKMDDAGLKLSRSASGGLRWLGRALLRGMPKLMEALSVVGTAAMLWVGGHLLASGAAELGWTWPQDLTEQAAHLTRGWPLADVWGWLSETALLALFGFMAGSVVLGLAGLRRRFIPKREHNAN